MTRNVMLVVLVAMAAVVSGCATIFGSSDEYVKFTSEPKGATVKINGQERGETPLILRLPADESHRVTYSLDEYRDISFVVDRTTNPWIWANFLSLGVGFIVDFATGKAYTLEHEEYHQNFPRPRANRNDRENERERRSSERDRRERDREEKPTRRKDNSRRDDSRERH